MAHGMPDYQVTSASPLLGIHKGYFETDYGMLGAEEEIDIKTVEGKGILNQINFGVYADDPAGFGINVNSYKIYVDGETTASFDITISTLKNACLNVVGDWGKTGLMLWDTTAGEFCFYVQPDIGFHTSIKISAKNTSNAGNSGSEVHVYLNYILI